MAPATAAALTLAGASWAYIGEGRQPATFSDCPGAVLTISTSGSAYVWRKFCYYGAGRESQKPVEQKRVTTPR